MDPLQVTELHEALGMKPDGAGLPAEVTPVPIGDIGMTAPDEKPKPPEGRTPEGIQAGILVVAAVSLMVFAGTPTLGTDAVVVGEEVVETASTDVSLEEGEGTTVLTEEIVTVAADDSNVVVESVVLSDAVVEVDESSGAVVIVLLPDIVLFDADGGPAGPPPNQYPL